MPAILLFKQDDDIQVLIDKGAITRLRESPPITYYQVNPDWEITVSPANGSIWFKAPDDMEACYKYHDNGVFDYCPDEEE